MEQIEKMKAELEQVQKDLTWYCNKVSKNFGYSSNPYHKEINELWRRKFNLKNKINQLRLKHWYWK